MKKKYLWIAAAVAAALCLFWIGTRLHSEIGVFRGDILADARQGHHIPESWQAAYADSDTMAAMVFYHPERTECTVSIYYRDNEPFPGYHFRFGSNGGEVKWGIGRFEGEDMPDWAYLSMNALGAVRAETADGTIQLDPEEPFALIVPKSAGEARFYDRNGNEIEVGYGGI